MQPYMVQSQSRNVENFDGAVGADWSTPPGPGVSCLHVGCTCGTHGGMCGVCQMCVLIAAALPRVHRTSPVHLPKRTRRPEKTSRCRVASGARAARRPSLGGVRTCIRPLSRSSQPPTRPPLHEPTSTFRRAAGHEEPNLAMFCGRSSGEPLQDEHSWSLRMHTAKRPPSGAGWIKLYELRERSAHYGRPRGDHGGRPEARVALRGRAQGAALAACGTDRPSTMCGGAVLARRPLGARALGFGVGASSDPTSLCHIRLQHADSYRYKCDLTKL